MPRSRDRSGIHSPRGESCQLLHQLSEASPAPRRLELEDFAIRMPVPMDRYATEVESSLGVAREFDPLRQRNRLPSLVPLDTHEAPPLQSSQQPSLGDMLESEVAVQGVHASEEQALASHSLLIETVAGGTKEFGHLLDQSISQRGDSLIGCQSSSHGGPST